MDESESLLVSLRPRLRDGLVAAYGLEIGAECCADAMAWGWEHRCEVVAMSNPAGYLFRVGQSAARSYRKRQGFLPRPDPHRMPDVEPGLASALEQLSEAQRVAVLAVHSLGWSQQEAADLLGISHSSIRTHLARGMKKLRRALEVDNGC